MSANAEREQELLSLEHDRIAKKLPQLHSPAGRKILQSIGILRYEPVKDDPKILTGFFIEPDLFLTARNPADIIEPDCKSMTIWTGNVVVDKYAIKGQQEFKCRQVIQTNLSYGFMVVQIEGRSAHHFPLTPKGRYRLSSASRMATVVGYSKEGHQFISRNCEVSRGHCKFCEQHKNLSLEKTAWTEAVCLYRGGMAGSPVFFDDGKGNFELFGMVGTLVGVTEGLTIQSLFDMISVVKLIGIQIRFGPDLTGRKL